MRLRQVYVSLHFDVVNKINMHRLTQQPSAVFSSLLFNKVVFVSISVELMSSCRIQCNAIFWLDSMLLTITNFVMDR
jgi:hypothetical protein